MRSKLGIFNEEEQDVSLINDLLGMMKKHCADLTNTFRNLSYEKRDETALFRSSEFIQWYDRWQARLGRQQQSKEASMSLMKNYNPVLIPRNHRVEEALEAAVKHDDLSVMERFLDALSNPYTYSSEKEVYCTLPEPSSRPYRTYCGT